MQALLDICFVRSRDNSSCCLLTNLLSVTYLLNLFCQTIIGILGKGSRSLLSKRKYNSVCLCFPNSDLSNISPHAKSQCRRKRLTCLQSRAFLLQQLGRTIASLSETGFVDVKNPASIPRRLVQTCSDKIRSDPIQCSKQCYHNAPSDLSNEEWSGPVSAQPACS